MSTDRTPAQPEPVTIPLNFMVAVDVAAYAERFGVEPSRGMVIVDLMERLTPSTTDDLLRLFPELEGIATLAQPPAWRPGQSN
ncbi:hypothetical protein [Kitasatospora viridis]|uniref:Uncharacterized protein n=1 Tax=Kitasatospora viridis TaxID=281105 RepID=A0A561SA39_9ACTN|nr:hypothetical protein [Kitasatospora viridis]TWF71717.1 hypothetical protein FHX73_1888 [Kitasatospora viridis]